MHVKSDDTARYSASPPQLQAPPAQAVPVLAVAAGAWQGAGPCTTLGTRPPFIAIMTAAAPAICPGVIGPSVFKALKRSTTACRYSTDGQVTGVGHGMGIQKLLTEECSGTSKFYRFHASPPLQLFVPLRRAQYTLFSFALCFDFELSM